MQKSIDLSIYRGGTSKALFIKEDQLPIDQAERDQILLKLMGSPDPHQINGLGGAVSMTSKVAIIKRSNRPDCDVDYTFAQVSIDKKIVSYAGNCGNISSAVGVYAIEEGLVEAKEKATLVRIFNTNTQKTIHEYVPTTPEGVIYSGDYEIAGVPGSASKLKLEFIDPAGSLTGKLLPTGNPVDKITVADHEIEVSIVDAANPLVYVRASDVGLSGLETPAEINGDLKLLNLLEEIRGKTAVLMGLIDDWTDSSTLTPGVPKMTIVSPSQNYTATTGETYQENDYNLSVRMMSMQRAHQAIALTGALCTGAAVNITGTIPNQLVSNYKNSDLLIGHCSGLIEVSCKMDEESVKSVTGYRTARKLMDGTAYYL